jgi:hypothetical protein
MTNLNNMSFWPNHEKWHWSKFTCTPKNRGTFMAFSPGCPFRNVHFLGFKTKNPPCITVSNGYTLTTEDIEFPGPEWDTCPIQRLLYKVKETYTDEGVLLPKDFEIVDEFSRKLSAEQGICCSDSIVWEGEVYLPCQ